MSKESDLLDVSKLLAEIGFADAARNQIDGYRATHQTQVLTILMTDLEASTRQQSELGNLRAYELTRRHRELFRELLKQFDGIEVETAGDAFLVVFAAPSEGVRFALHMQALMAKARETEPDLPRVRVGLHQGQVVVERHEPGSGTGAPGKAMDIYGLQVSTTARIMDLGGGRQILLTRHVFDDARAILRGDALQGLGQVEWLNHGPYTFKGVADPYDVCEVGETGRAPLSKPEGSEKSHPAEAGDVIYGWRPGPEAIVPTTSWRLEHKLGEGGFGEVWLAQDKDQPARKTVFKFCTKKSKVKSLRREKDVFDHLVDDKGNPLPGITQVSGANDDSDGGKPPYYIQLEYCAGGDLRQWIDAHGKTVTQRIKLDVALQMTRALERIHGRGFIHRDVKPANYLLEDWGDTSRAPDLKISDFGIGQEVLHEAIAQGQATADLAGGGGRFSVHSETLSQAAGTFLFIAPELVVRKQSTPGRVSRQAEPKADIYSLGVSLYQLFAGSAEAVPGPGLRDVTDPILREDLEACLDPDPDKRPDAGELADRLDRYDARVAEREAAVERDRQRQRNRKLKAIAGVAGLVAAVSLVFGGMAAWQWREASKQQTIAEEQRSVAVKNEKDAEEQRGIAETRSVEAEEQRGEAERLLYSSSIHLAKNYLDKNQLQLAEETLWRAPEPLRRWEWGYLMAQMHTELTQLDLATVWPGISDTNIQMSAENNRVLISTDEGMGMWNFSTSEVLKIAEEYNVDYIAANLSPDGAKVVAPFDDGSAGVWNAITGELLFKTEEPAEIEEYAELAWYSPSGSHIVVLCEDYALRVNDASSGDLIATLDGHTDDVNSICFSPSGDQLVTASDDGTARLWNVATGHLDAILKADEDTANMNTAAFSPDGKYILTVPDEGFPWIWDAASGEKPLSLSVDFGGFEGGFFMHSDEESATIYTYDYDQTYTWFVDYAQQSVQFMGYLESEVYLAISTSDCSDLTRASDAAGIIFKDGVAYFGLAVPSQAKNDIKIAAGLSSISFVSGTGASVSYDDWARLWNVNELSSTVALAFDRLVGRGPLPLVVTPDRRMAALQRPRNRFAVFKTSSLEAVAWLQFQEDEEVTSLTLSPDGSRAVAVIRMVEGPDSSVNEPSYSGDEQGGGVIAEVLKGLDSQDSSYSGRGETVLFDLSTGEELARLESDTWEETVGGGFSTDGSRFVVIGPDSGMATVHAAETGERLFGLRQEGDYILPFMHAVFSPDGSVIATTNGPIWARIVSGGALWDGETGNLIAMLEDADNYNPPVFSPQGKLVALPDASRHTVYVWDAHTGERISVCHPPESLNESEEIGYVYFRSEDELIASTINKTWRWNPKTGQSIDTFSGGHAYAVSIMFQGYPLARIPRLSPAGDQIITADSVVHIWSLDTHEETVLAPDLVGTGIVGSLDYSPDGDRVLVGGSDGIVRVFDAKTWEELLALDGMDGTRVFFSPDGQRILSFPPNTSLASAEAAPWRLQDLPILADSFTSREEEWQARLDEWRRQRSLGLLAEHGLTDTGDNALE